MAVSKIIVVKKDVDKYDQVLTCHDDFKYIDNNKLSNDYINFIGKLNKKYNSIIWNSGSISSKNQYVSNLYRNICYYIEIIEYGRGRSRVL